MHIRTSPRALSILLLAALIPAAIGAARARDAGGVPRAAPLPHRRAVGRIEGEVIISTTLATRRPRFRIYSDPGPGARPPVRQTEEIRNVVLYLRNAPVPPVPEGAAHGTMEQRDERFVPHVLPVQRGATVDFPNADEVFHNVFSLSSAKAFDLGRYPKGESKSVRFDRSGSVQVFCHIHSDMSAVVLVLDNPYFAVPAANGRYALEDVPPGDYTVIGWHERIVPVQRTVHVVAGQTARLDFNIPLPDGGEDARH